MERRKEVEERKCDETKEKSLKNLEGGARDLEKNIEEEKKFSDLSKKNNSIGLKKNYVTVEHELFLEIKKIVSRCNKKLFGEKINPTDVIKYSIAKLNDADIKSIQEESFSLMDKVKLEHIKYVDKAKESISFEEFLAMKLKIQ